MAKRIVACNLMKSQDTNMECLEGIRNKHGAQLIANHFAAVSNQYSPIDSEQLPSYLAAEAPQQLIEYDAYKRLKGKKDTQKTLPIDIPH